MHIKYTGLVFTSLMLVSGSVTAYENPKQVIPVNITPAWGEIDIDRSMSNCERIVDEQTGQEAYYDTNGKFWRLVSWPNPYLQSKPPKTPKLSQYTCWFRGPMTPSSPFLYASHIFGYNRLCVRENDAPIPYDQYNTWYSSFGDGQTFSDISEQKIAIDNPILEAFFPLPYILMNPQSVMRQLNVYKGSFSCDKRVNHVMQNTFYANIQVTMSELF